MTMITPSAQLTLTKGNKSWSSTAPKNAMVQRCGRSRTSGSPGLQEFDISLLELRVRPASWGATCGGGGGAYAQ